MKRFLFEAAGSPAGSPSGRLAGKSAGGDRRQLARDSGQDHDPDNHPAPVVPDRDTQVWIGLHFPDLALRVCDFAEGLPALVIDQRGGRQLVHAACPVAMDYGIAPGMSLNAAHVLCRNLAIQQRDPAAEYRRLCACCDQLRVFTPHIAPGIWHGRGAAGSDGKGAARQAVRTHGLADGAGHDADSLLLEVSGSLNLFGGLHALTGRIRAEFDDHLLSPVLSVAPCPSAALVLARNGLEKVVVDTGNLRAVLGELALDSIDIGSQLAGRLQRCGLHRLRDLWRMPRADLGRRFGAGLLLYLDRLAGLQQEPVARQAPATCFRQRLELPVHTRHSKLIMLAAERLLDEARRFLEMHGAATGEVGFDLWHAKRMHGSGCRTMLRVCCSQADRHPRRFLPQLEQQLERQVLDREVEAVSIRIDQVVPFNRSSEDLFRGCSEQAEQWSQVLDLIGARLGREQVYTLAVVADHRPERAWGKNSPVDRAHRGAGEDKEALAGLAARPLWLLECPRLLGNADLAAGPAITGCSEPERIETGWWERKDIRRDYQVAEVDRSGGGSGPATAASWGWVYRKPGRHSGQDDRVQDWYLHGLFG